MWEDFHWKTSSDSCHKDFITVSGEFKCLMMVKKLFLHPDKNQILEKMYLFIKNSLLNRKAALLIRAIYLLKTVYKTKN